MAEKETAVFFLCSKYPLGIDCSDFRFLTKLILIPSLHPISDGLNLSISCSSNGSSSGQENRCAADQIINFFLTVRNSGYFLLDYCVGRKKFPVRDWEQSQPHINAPFSLQNDMALSTEMPGLEKVYLAPGRSSIFHWKSKCRPEVQNSCFYLSIADHMDIY